MRCPPNSPHPSGNGPEILSVLPLFRTWEAELGGKTKTDVVVRVRRRVVVAISTATVGSVVVPTAPTIDTIGACTLRKYSEYLFSKA